MHLEPSYHYQVVEKAQETSEVDVSWPRVCFLLFSLFFLITKFLDANLYDYILTMCMEQQQMATTTLHIHIR